MWVVTPEGELTMIFSSIALGLLDDEDLPRDKIWDAYDDASWTDDDQKLKERAYGRIKAAGFKADAIPLPDLRVYDIFTIHWPSNVARLIFDNAWEALKEYRPFHADLTWYKLLEVFHELAEAVDSIMEDGNKTRTQWVLDQMEEVSIE